LAKIPIVGKIAESGDNGNPIALDLTSPVAQTFRTLVQNLKQELEKE